MTIQKSSYNYIIDALTSNSAGNELILAMQNASLLSPYTYNRLVIAMSDAGIGADIQAAIVGGKALSARDKQYLADGFASSAVALDAINNIINNPANSINPPQSNGMPAGFSLSSVRNGQQQTASLSYPAGSAFASTGAGAYIVLYNGGNATGYYAWYSVLGGSNTDPAPAGLTGIQVSILASDSAAAIATKTAAAINSNALGINAIATSNSVAAVSAVIALPISSLPAGTYSGTQFVAISSLTPGTLFYYTLDGSNPTLASSLYASPISIGTTETLKVLSVSPNGGNSAISSASYVITGAGGVATHIVYTTQPGTVAQGVAWSPQPIITIKDASGATVTSGPDATAVITLSLLTGTGALAGTVSMAAVAGVANFSGKGVNNTVFGNKVIRATKADTTSGGGTIAFTVDSNILNISNSLAIVNLATAANYAILSEAGITNTSGSFVTGNMGVSPIASTAITGFSLVLDGSGTFSTSSQVSGHIFAADYTSPTPSTLTTAISDMNAAYTDAAGRAGPDFTNLGSGEIGGLTLVSGLYKWTTGVTISNNVTISGGPNDVFIFQISGTLTMAAAKSVILTGGVVPSNIFWQTSGAVTIGANAVFNGNILSATGINLTTNAAANGRLLAGTSVTLESNAVVQ